MSRRFPFSALPLALLAACGPMNSGVGSPAAATSGTPPSAAPASTDAPHTTTTNNPGPESMKGSPVNDQSGNVSVDSARARVDSATAAGMRARGVAPADTTKR